MPTGKGWKLWGDWIRLPTKTAETRDILIGVRGHQGQDGWQFVRVRWGVGRSRMESCDS